MTPESLKQAYAKEAVRLYLENEDATSLEEIAFNALTLAETDWRPPEPVNPDLIEARECCALAAEKIGIHDLAARYRAGKGDDWTSVQSTLLAIERAKGREVGS